MKEKKSSLENRVLQRALYIYQITILKRHGDNFCLFSGIVTKNVTKRHEVTIFIPITPIPYLSLVTYAISTSYVNLQEMPLLHEFDEVKIRINAWIEIQHIMHTFPAPCGRNAPN